MSWQGAFTVHGRMDGEDVVLTWDDGRLSGTDAAVRAVSSALDGQDRVQLSPQDEERDADVSDAHATMAAVQQVMEIVEVEGDAPIPDADNSAS
jgi:hypothetical protein